MSMYMSASIAQATYSSLPTSKEGRVPPCSLVSDRIRLNMYPRNPLRLSVFGLSEDFPEDDEVLGLLRVSASSAHVALRAQPRRS